MRNFFLIVFFILFAEFLPAGNTYKSTERAPGFIENKGQIIDQNNKPNPGVLYLLNTPGLNVQLRKTGFSYDVYSLTDKHGPLSVIENNTPPYPVHHPDSLVRECHFHRIDMEMEGMNPGYSIVTSEPSADYLNYYTTGTPVNGTTVVRYYKTVTYKSIYPGIDLEFLMTPENGFKYNFIIHPDGKLSDIKLKITGPDHIRLTRDTLQFTTNPGVVNELIPESYFLNNESKTSIKSHFREIDDGVYSFSIDGDFSEASTLVIDPTSVRIWGTYYGGSGNDVGYKVSVDNEYNVILGGTTLSSDNIATAGAYDTIKKTFEDMFIAKFTANGVRLWGTYYGGDGTERLLGLKNDILGNIYVAGWTCSNSYIASPGSFQDTCSSHLNLGPSAPFLAKFSPNGWRIWGTYYGGQASDQANDVDVDQNGDVYLAGATAGSYNLGTPGTYQPAYYSFNSMGGDGFIAKFDSSGARIWGTYYGKGCLFSGISVDSSGTIYAAGATRSTDTIASSGAYQTVYGGGWADAFLAAFSQSGQRLWGTYYGGPAQDGDWVGGDDFPNIRCKADNTGSVYLIGFTSSQSGIASTGGFQPTYGGGTQDGFIAKFNSLGQRAWGSYYGGSGYDYVYNCSLGGNGDVFFTGETNSTNGIATAGSYMPAYNGGDDAFLVKFDRSGQRPWGTYFGGSAFDNALSSAYVADDTIYFSGNTYSTSNIASPGAHQVSYASGSDAYLEKFIECWPIAPAQAITGPASACQGTNGLVYSTVSLDHAVGYKWTLPPGASIESGFLTNTIVVDFGSSASSGLINVKGQNKCGDSGDSATLFVTVNVPPVPVISGPDTSCTGSGKLYSTAPGKTNYQWSTSTGGSVTAGGNTETATVIWTTAGAQQVHVTYSENGCQALTPSVFDVWVNSGPLVNISIAPSANNVCAGTPVTCTATPVNGGANPVYQWKVNGVNAGSNSPVFTYSPLNGDQVTCVLTSDAICSMNNPATSNTITMVVYPNLAVSIQVSPSANPVCAGTNVTYTATALNGGSSPVYQWKVNGLDVGTNSLTYTYVPLNGDVVSCVLISSITYCVSNNPATSNAITMTVNPSYPVDVSISASANPVCSGIPVIFTALPVNGGSSPVYQWKVNGSTTGTNSATFSYSPSNNDQVQCILTSSYTLCTSNNPAASNTITMTVNPLSVVSVSIAVSANPVCSGTPVTFTATPVNGGSSPVYQWKVNAVIVGGNSSTFTYTPLNNDAVSCVLTSSLTTCVTNNPATSNTVSMGVNPLMPVSVSITASANPVCAGLPVTFSASPVNGGSSPAYQWKVNAVNAGGNSSTYSYTPVSGDQVNCTLTSDINCPQGNPALSNTITMILTPTPSVSFSVCQDTVTSLNAQPFKLKGGIPLGGTYSGPGVNSLTGYFNPSVAGTGVKPISYTYQNQSLCSDVKTRSILVQTSPSFTCGQTLTDIRDGKTYPTVLLGTQCWMRANLNYGSFIAGTLSQTDNCQVEKYCYNDDASNCTVYGGLYQWDELMQYQSTVPLQGLCPPGWHIPTQAEWMVLFTWYQEQALAAKPLQDTIIAGFRAKESGVIYSNFSWSFKGFATIFWTSTSSGTIKALSHGMNLQDFSVSDYYANRSNAFAVRCVKD